MAQKELRQKGPRLRLGDIIRVKDKIMAKPLIAVVVADDGDEDWPWSCMFVDSRDHMNKEYWPIEYDLIGNINDLVSSHGG